MERLGEVAQGVVSPWIDEAQIKCISYIQSDLPGNFIDRDVYYERIGRMEAQKYLRESCYHRIECSVTSSLASLMRK